MSQPQPPLKYKRILLKLSGQVLAGTSYHGLDFEVLERICDEIVACAQLGIQIALVVGGSNFWHSAKDLKNLPDAAPGLDPIHSDQMGLLGTVINALALSDVLGRKGIDTRVLSAIGIDGLAEPYIKGRADRHLRKGRVVIIGGGTGNPCFSTDAAAILHAAELKAHVVLIGKSSSVLSALSAETHRAITYEKLLAEYAGILDTTAATLARDTHTVTLLFSPVPSDNIRRAANGEVVGTTLY